MCDWLIKEPREPSTYYGTQLGWPFSLINRSAVRQSSSPWWLSLWTRFLHVLSFCESYKISEVDEVVLIRSLGRWIRGRMGLRRKRVVGGKLVWLYILLGRIPVVKLCNASGGPTSEAFGPSPPASSQVQTGPVAPTLEVKATRLEVPAPSRG